MVTKKIDCVFLNEKMNSSIHYRSIYFDFKGILAITRCN